jgi:hypothetical protein
MWSPLCFITAVQRLGKSCIPVRTPSLLMCLITRVTSLDTSSMLLKRFPRNGFDQFWEQVKVWWAHVRTVRRVGKHLSSILFQNFRYCTWGMRPRVIVIWLQSVCSSISRVRLQNRNHLTCQYTHSVLCRSLAHSCSENQKDCIILLAAQAQCAERLKWPT